MYPPASGNIVLAQKLDIYQTPEFNLTIAASNSDEFNASFPDVSISDQLTVRVIVNDTDDHGPSFGTSTSPSPNCTGIDEGR